MRLATSAQNLGIVLVTTLLTTVLVVMLVTAMVYYSAGSLALTSNFFEREAALLAADSGLQYAMTRLQEKATWQGVSVVGDSLPGGADFSVVEKNGNVLGFLTTVFGHRSQFRIKFNYEDDANGGTGLDGLSDTSAGDSRYLLEMPFVSVNNLGGLVPLPLRRARPDGRGVAPGEPVCMVPRRTACILVEGVAGWGLRDVDPQNPGTLLSDRAVTRRVVEAYLALDESGNVDSVAYAGGDISASLAPQGTFRLASADPEEAARLRSLKNVRITGSGKVTFNGGKESEVVVGEGREFTVRGVTPPGVEVTQADSSSLFKRLSWESIPKASASSVSDAQLPAGTYVWRTDETDPDQARLEYFDQDYTAGADLPAQGTGKPVDTLSILARGSGVTVDPQSAILEITNNVSVNPSQSGAKGLAILVDSSLTAGGSRVGVMFSPATASSRAPVLTASGSILLKGSASGMGSMTSEGDIRLQGSSVLETDPETGVSLYAKGNIAVESMPPQVAAKTTILVDFVRDYADDGGNLGALYDAVTTGAVSGMKGTDLAAFAAAVGQLDKKERARLAKQWKKAAGDGSEKAKTAFLERLEKQLAASSLGSSGDQSLTGMLYTWKNFQADLGSARLFLRGVLVAYGGNPEDPADDSPGLDGGNIAISAGDVSLTYDPTYVRDLVGLTDRVKLRRTLWATY